MVAKGGKLLYLHGPPPQVKEETTAGSGVRMRVCGSALPLFEALALSGSNMAEPAESRAALSSKLESFRKPAAPALESAIEGHARNYKTGFYKYDDPGGLEQNRQVGVLSVAIYLLGTVDRMWERLGRMDDAGSSSLFEATLDRITALMGPDFYKSTPGDIGNWFSDNADMLGQCLSVLGLHGRAMSLQRVIESTVPELVERTKESFRHL